MEEDNINEGYKYDIRRIQFVSPTDARCTIGNANYNDDTDEIIYTTTATTSVCNSVSSNAVLTTSPYYDYYEWPSYTRTISHSSEVEVESLKEQIAELTKRISNLTSIILSHVGEAEMEKLIKENVKEEDA